MSLKTFHLIFISFSILLASYIAVWAFGASQQMNQPMGYVLTGIGAVLTGLFLVVYELIFLRKMKEF